MTRQLLNLLRIIRASLASNRYWGPALVENGIPLSAVSRNYHTNQLQLDPFPNPLRPSGTDWYLKAYWHAIALHRSGKARFSSGDAGAVRVTTEHFVIDVDTPEELFILNEVISDGCYYFSQPSPAVVLDIGANVGITALFLASALGYPVVGYEIVPETYQRAMHNLTLNPRLKPLVTLNNVGVGRRDCSVVLNTIPGQRGLSSVFRRESNGPVSSIEGRMVSASSVVGAARERFPSHTLVAKIDCEGAEYEIIDCLAESGELRSVGLLMIEWHRFLSDHSPARLVKQLGENGFSCVALGDMSGPAGMLYAFGGCSNSVDLVDGSQESCVVGA